MELKPIYSLILSYSTISPLYAVVMSIFKDDDLLYYMQHNQSEKLSRSADVDTNYYAVAGVSVKKNEELAKKRVIITEFVPIYESKEAFQDSIRCSSDYADVFCLDFSDNVVELPSQLGVRFDGNSVSDIIKFECMSVIAHNGTYDNIVDSFHVKILHERSLHEKIVEYIID